MPKSWRVVSQITSENFHMTNEKSPRRRASIDLGEFSDFQPAAGSQPAQDLSRAVAEEEGFTSRQTTKKPKIDGRSLRATGRKEQLNIAVKPDTKSDFWSLAQEAGFTRGEEFLLAMMKVWSEQKK